MKKITIHQLYYVKCPVNHLLVIMLISVFSLPIYILFEYMINAPYNVINLMLVFSTVIMISCGIYDVKKKGINLSNVFAIFYFGVLLMNNLNISALQKEKTIVDAYYFLSGPIIYFLILRFYNKIGKKRLKKRISINADIIGIIIIILCLILKIYIYNVKGIRFFSTLWRTEEAMAFTIPGATGMADIFLWLSLMMVPVIRKKWLKVLAILVPTVCIVLSASRQDFIILGVYIGLAWGMRYGKQFFSKKNTIRCLAMLMIMLVIFSVWGNYRQKKIGWTNVGASIAFFMESRTDNFIVNWVYGYTGINFDVLKQEVIEKEKTEEFRALVLPIMRIFGGTEAVLEYENEVRTYGLNGYNASSFLGRYIREFGVFYLVDIMLLAVLVIILDYLCCLADFRGGQVFLLTMTALTFFGDYYMGVVSMFFAIVIGIIIHFMVNTTRNR